MPIDFESLEKGSVGVKQIVKYKGIIASVSVGESHLVGATIEDLTYSCCQFARLAAHEASNDGIFASYTEEFISYENEIMEHYFPLEK